MLVTVKTVGVAVEALALTAVFVALGRRLKFHGARSWAPSRWRRLWRSPTGNDNAARVDALFSTNDRVELENSIDWCSAHLSARRRPPRPRPSPGLKRSRSQPKSLDVAAKWGLRINTEAGRPSCGITSTRRSCPSPASQAPTKPNVIVLFYESLSAHMLEPYGAPHPGLTPNFNAMAKRSMVVDHWYNHVTPTVTGLRGQLCSLFPKLTWTPWVKAKKKPKVGMVYCLPHLLAANGYRTLYWSHVKPHVTYLKAQSIDWGFTEPSFHKQVTQPWIGEAPSSKGFGATDRQMMRALTAFIAKEPHDERPFFLALSTVQTHTGFSIGADGKPYKRPGGKARDQVLDTFHNLDDAFGDFWRAFQRSPRAKDTIVIVTADHALYPSDSHRAVAGPGYLDSKFSKLGFILYDPTHKLPGRWNAHSTSVDLAPTLAHLLELPQRKVPWLGWSIFGDRQRYKGALGLIYSEKLLSVDADGPRLDAAVGAKAAALRAVLGYTQTIEEQGLIWLK